MYCTHCGAEIMDNSPFCAVCGRSVSQPKKKRLWLFFPAAALILVFIGGLFTFFTSLLMIQIPAQDRVSDETVPTFSAQIPDIPENSETGGSTVDTSRWYILADGELYFVPELYTGGKVLTIPDSINGQTVTSIAPEGFADCDGVTTINLPDTLTSIGDRAFAECDDLRGLALPEAVTDIGEEAFYNCDNLESVYIPTSVSSIGSQAFEGCPALLYIFYSGPYSEWETLYSEYITPFTYVICLDGEYPHGAIWP